jgi:hypothetical protein
MSADSRQVVPGIKGLAPDPLPERAEFEDGLPQVSPISEERRAEIERIVAQRNLPLIQEGIEAYKRDLPWLLSENRYRQLVAYRGTEPVAFGRTHRQLRRRLEKKGLTDRGELFITSIAPLDIDEDEDFDS